MKWIVLALPKHHYNDSKTSLTIVATNTAADNKSALVKVPCTTFLIWLSFQTVRWVLIIHSLELFYLNSSISPLYLAMELYCFFKKYFKGIPEFSWILTLASCKEKVKMSECCSKCMFLQLAWVVIQKNTSPFVDICFTRNILYIYSNPNPCLIKTKPYRTKDSLLK